MSSPAPAGAARSGKAGSTWVDLLFLAGLGALVTLPGLGQEGDWGSREVRHALVALEIADSGEFLISRRLGAEYADKPPVLHALAALLYRLAGGPSMGLARFPSAVAGILGALACYGLGRFLHGRPAALLAAASLLGAPGYASIARTARPDMIFSAAILAATLALTAAMARETFRRRLVLLLLAGLASGLATLTKGPYGFLFPLFAALVVPFQPGSWRRPRAGEWLVLAAGFLVVPGLWALAIWLRGRADYLRDVLWQPDLASGASSHARQFFWYLGPAFLSALPMSVFLPWALADLRRRRSASAWLAGAVLLVLSCVPGKRTHYLVPWYPFCLLAVAESLAERERVVWLRRLARGAVALSLAAVPIYFALLLPLRGDEPYRRAAARVLDAAPEATRFVCYRGMGEPVAFVAAGAGRAAWREVREAWSPGALAAELERARGSPGPICLVVKEEDQEAAGALTRELDLKVVASVRAGGGTVWKACLLEARGGGAPSSSPR